MAATTDLFISWGVDEGVERCYVECGELSREFSIESDTDFKIDLFDFGLSAREISLVMADVEDCRSRALLFDDYDPPRAPEAPRPEELPAVGTRLRRDAAAGLFWFYLAAGCAAWALFCFGLGRALWPRGG